MVPAVVYNAILRLVAEFHKAIGRVQRDPLVVVMVLDVIHDFAPHLLRRGETLHEVEESAVPVWPMLQVERSLEELNKAFRQNSFDFVELGCKLWRLPPGGCRHTCEVVPASFLLVSDDGIVESTAAFEVKSF